MHHGHAVDLHRIASTAVSIASASIPSAALALMFIVLNAVGVPTADIGLLFAVDWLVDRVRTTNNQLGDCYAAAIVERLSRKELREMDMVKENGDIYLGPVPMSRDNSQPKRRHDARFEEIHLDRKSVV